MNKKHYIKLKFIKKFGKEYWFIENKYNEARKFIGEKRFIYIMNQNIPNCYSKNKEIFYRNLKKYIEANKKILVLSIAREKTNLEKKWRRFEKDFFQQIQKITKLNWQHKNYKAYLLYSCFWGGDYDINKPNIYISPLLKYGDPLYIIFHELSHLIYWEYISKKYGGKFIKKNYKLIWKLSEIMVNYPLVKMKINFNFPLVVPENLKKFSSGILKKFPSTNFANIIDDELRKAE